MKGVIIKQDKEDAVYEQVFGTAEDKPIDWTPYLPNFERQGNTAFCVSFARLNCAETMAKRDKLELNLSDRHLGVVSNTTKQGNGLKAVAEAFRKKGIVKEGLFKWKSEYLINPEKYWKEIFDTSPIPKEARRYYGGNYSWVSTKLIKSALAHSPIQIAFGVGETYHDIIIRKPKNITSYHSVMLYHINPDGNYRIFDSADGAKKILDKDYPIIQAMSFRDLPENWKLAQSPRKTLLDIIGQILRTIAETIGLLKKEVKELEKKRAKIPIKVKKYLWDTPRQAKHSSRVIMDKYGLSWKEKNLLCAVIQCESGFNPKATHKNKNGTADWGIVMVNDYYWIGKGKKFPSADYVLNNPEVCVRWMIKEYKNGHLNWWICYKGGYYKKYL